MTDGGRRGADDRCPGALRVHRAADGGLVRVRVPGGVLDLARWRALARCAGEYADGGAELTGRGNIQLRGVPAGAETDLAAALAAGGLLPSATHERVRNIVASPLAGRDGAGRYDVRGLVGALDAGLCADPALAGLPGRFLFALDDGRGDVLALRPDAALLATGAELPAALPATGAALPATGAELALWCAGADTGLRVAPGAAVPALLAAARAFLAERDTPRTGPGTAPGGPAWRIAELPDGASRVARRVAAALGLRASAAAAAPPAAPDPPVGVLPQRDGRVAVAAVAPLGRLTADQLAALAARSAGALVVTPWRSVLLPDLADAPAAVPALAAAGLVTDPRSPWIGVTACAGTDCARALADVRGDARTVHGGHAVRGPVHWSGCDRHCGRPGGAVLHAVATGDGYRYDGGDAGAQRVAAALRRGT
ncbi:precorrin-3B synthase [Pilimelia terevasa]|uniref:Precorrin-3B synthase n=1 Tax=Pilimelia terevasa TaxID=53372 RepID=A0A8J3BV54_9ACTN|nr:precorrin-3B synthase [Pilimelia terevasa]GGK43126.1 precorrin-3B synthase [Pilimelia terevasa]